MFNKKGGAKRRTTEFAQLRIDPSIPAVHESVLGQMSQAQPRLSAICDGTTLHSARIPKFMWHDFQPCVMLTSRPIIHQSAPMPGQVSDMKSHKFEHMSRI